MEDKDFIREMRDKYFDSQELNVVRGTLNSLVLIDDFNFLTKNGIFEASPFEETEKSKEIIDTINKQGWKADRASVVYGLSEFFDEADIPFIQAIALMLDVKDRNFVLKGLKELFQTIEKENEMERQHIGE